MAKEQYDNTKEVETLVVKVKSEVLSFRHKEEGNGDSVFLLTFARCSVQERVCLKSTGYHVREYYRPLLYCYNCRRFGHVAGSCQS